MSSLDFLSSMLTITFRPLGRRSPPRSSHSGKPDKDIRIVAGLLCSMELAGGREGGSRQLVQHSQQPSASGRARRVDPKNVVKTTLVLVRRLLSSRRVLYPTRIVQVLLVSDARHGVRSGGFEDCSGRRGSGIGVVRRYVLFIFIRKGVSTLVDFDDARMCFSMHLILRRRCFFRL